MPYHVFVYGTLKPGERAYGQFCEPYVVEHRDAIALGRLYNLPLGYPAMTLEAGWVQGVRLTFTDLAVLARLDQFEEYFPDRPAEESEYQRLEQPIFTPDREPLGKAWVYLMKFSKIEHFGGIWLPRGRWSGN